MTLSDEKIVAEIDKILNALSVEREDLQVSKIRPIIYSNFDRGRITSFLEDKIEYLKDYLLRIIENYDNLNSYLHKLQIEKDNDTWKELLEELQSWAYSYFLGKNFNPGSNTLEIAKSQATEAAITILNAHFPYDVDFAPWARVITIHTCQRFIRNSVKKSVIPSENLVSIDLVSEFDKNLETNPKIKGEIAIDMLQAVDKLPETRQIVIKMIYFEGKSPLEVAEALNKSVGAIYSLHFNSLKELRKILG